MESGAWGLSEGGGDFGRSEAGGLVPAPGSSGSPQSLRLSMLHLTTCLFKTCSFNKCSGKSSDGGVSLSEAVHLKALLTPTLMGMLLFSSNSRTTCALSP